MANECKGLPEECWELIFNRLHHQYDLESVSLACKQFLALTNRLRLHLSVNDSTLLIHGNLSLDDNVLTKVALMCPNMEILDVSSCTSLTEAGIAFALEKCNQISNLQLDDCPLTTLIGKGAELPNLEVISAAGSALNDEGLAMIGSRCSRLLKLNLENCKGVSAEGIQAMVKRCRSLRDINLKKCPQVSINSLNNLVFSSSSLRRVVPPCCSAFSDSLRGFYLHHGCWVSSG